MRLRCWVLQQIGYKIQKTLKLRKANEIMNKNDVFYHYQQKKSLRIIREDIDSAIIDTYNFPKHIKSTDR